WRWPCGRGSPPARPTGRPRAAGVRCHSPEELAPSVPLALLRRSQCRQETAVQAVRRQWADVLVPDGTVGADDEGLGHAVDAPVDGGAAALVDADCAEGIAEGAEEAARVFGI